eukprot:jgi/Mesvir1/18220/Mv09499-RA.1
MTTMTLGLITLNCPVSKHQPQAGMYRPSITRAHYCEVDADIDNSSNVLALHAFRFKVPPGSTPSDDDMRAVNMLFAILKGKYPRDHITIVDFEDHSSLYGTVYIVTSDNSNGPMPYDDFKNHRTLIDQELRKGEMANGGVVYEYP